ncbi:hypothetical protein BDR03DRAFT_986821 [Suillus americanus]|nr:hypothetical protein BDR03DRAFT_986821 [Suillus americanus]
MKGKPSALVVFQILSLWWLLVMPAVKTVASHSMVAIKANHDLAKSLKEGNSFVFKAMFDCKGINDMWFANHSDEDVLYAKYFNPLPVKMMVLVLMVWFQECTAPYKLLDKIRDNLLDVAQLYAGGINPCKTAVSVDAFANDIFNDAI